ncbi:hypothetical protein C6P40_002812 [Pichia californica]|uniref:Glutathione S-transferase n=1 Tax=Pichia californica TaxID=460514 RepID=A0A9P6WHM6_9ASCO|nr:hypothetical protein C6P42_002281 [[Candida] californica]KAG0687132.1 hypothetical protein C6P40_002812 [[Candida] californica]
MVHHIIKETESLPAPRITVFTACTPNGNKISILLELLQIEYYIRPVDLMENEQKSDWYLKFNPNGRIPSLEYVNEKGQSIYVNESAAIMMFIVDKFDKDFKYSFPHDSKKYYEMVEWLFFQMSGLGPMKGQYHWFDVYAPQKDEFATDRYYKETLRLFGVIDERLARNGTGFLVGDHLSIADIACYPWIILRQLKETDDFHHLTKWINTLTEIQGVKNGCNVLPSLI